MSHEKFGGAPAGTNPAETFVVMATRKWRIGRVPQAAADWSCSQLGDDSHSALPWSVEPSIDQRSSVEAELVAVAVSSATALVNLMITDSWAGARKRVAKILARGSTGQVDEIEGQLIASRTELLAAGPDDAEAAVRVVADWATRLQSELPSRPEIASELRELLADAEPHRSLPYLGDHIELHHNSFHGPVQIKGKQCNS
ncbi:hypothetical protein [Streptomyces sp. LS1784]|uniref:hypothetical protein n=1 Tax=Streptomyces sp. LS1784 TaxID=2851533 RepID=UPI001CCAC54B|nr:hypothetical protein [Streptomyces sp. LS1784]